MAKPSATKKYYIAFSIHGTNTFIVATRTMTDSRLAILGQSGIRITPSRRSNVDLSEGIKLHWDGLFTAEREPLRSPPHVLAKFKLLEQDGWTIVGREQFINYHWKKKPVK